MRRTSQGFGLVEIMVALVLGLVVSLGVIQIFTSSRATFLSQNAAARMQEDARFVLSKMIQELRMTDMYGCQDFARPAELNEAILWNNTTNTLTLITADIGTAGTAPTWTILSDCQTGAQLYSGARAPAAGQTAFPLRQLVYSYSNRTLSLNGQPLLQNVETFDVFFGVTGNPMSYTNVITAANASKIRSVRLSLVLRDPQGRAEDQPYSVVAYLRNRF